MSDLDFELNIEKYTHAELEQILNLKFPYSMHDIKDEVGKLGKQIMSDKNLEETKQQEIVMFLKSVKNKLHKNIVDMNHNITPNIVSQHNNHFVIERNSQKIKNKDGVAPSVKLHPYRTSPGKAVSFLNGWEDGITSHLISIDTRFRSNYYSTSSTDFIIDLPVSINNVVSLELISLEMPATYFDISKKKGNNYFHIIDTLAPGAIYKITLSDGNYSRDQMQTELNLRFQAEFSASIPQASIDKNSGRTIIDLQTVTRSMVFNLPQSLESSAVTSTTGPLDVIPIQMKLGWCLGYRAAEYKTTAPLTNYTFVSEGIFDAWGSRYFYFVMDDYNKNSINTVDAVLNASVLSENILARLTRSPISSSLNTGFILNTDVNYDSTTKKRIFYGPVNIKKLKIRIVDSYGRLVDLNNMDYSFALRLDRLYD